MLHSFIIGIGAAGNKAVKNDIDKQLISPNHTLLINTTTKDIPENYEQNGNVYIIKKDDNQHGGCGKESELGKNLMLEALKSNDIPLEEILPANVDVIIIKASTEGGTGSGGAPILAGYIKNILGINVIIVAFTGFENDVRGLKNTVRFFTDIPADVTTKVIRNKSFLQNAKGDFTLAEKMANEAATSELSILLGHANIDCDQNMDEADNFKLATKAGYTVVEYRQLNGDEKIKSKDHYDAIIREMINGSSAMDTTASNGLILGLIVNLPESERQYVDLYHSELTAKYGKFYETYHHIQYDEDNFPRFIAYIIAGMNLPIEEVKDIYRKYSDGASEAIKSTDSYFDSISKIDLRIDGDKFDVYAKASKVNKNARNDFFAQFDNEVAATSESPAPKSRKKTEDVNKL